MAALLRRMSQTAVVYPAVVGGDESALQSADVLQVSTLLSWWFYSRK